ncbi:excisionase family DNA binding protein [Haloactinopolyspora alba]|uniref:Excisionase family DNA binding protein n=1 Tax=Haloactinopolyspora alba TaxID=648780 RepID=A0A2P8DZ66_9ACTN|nr:excisionase family DNA-binding protein [Haloactinopolyspora alba]PSL02501.1 excisionase family DNA binding protein [Haloactinopolyspora alba]
MAVDSDALTAFVAGLEPAEGVELASTLRVGINALQAARTRNGARYDPTPARTVLAAVSDAGSGQRWPLSGRHGQQWASVAEMAGRTGVPGRTLRRWAASGRIRAERIGRTWWLYVPDVEKEIQK